MRLSSRARHAVRLTLEVHRQGDDGNPVRLSAVAAATNISKSFLEQLAMALKSHSILRAVCGRKGGYLLGRAADEITIGDVLRAVTSPIDLVTEVPKGCSTPVFCHSRLVWMLLEKRINQVLDDYTIADISDEAALESLRDLLDTKRAHVGGTDGVLQNR